MVIPQFGTQTDYKQKEMGKEAFLAEQSNKTQEQLCRERGGTWDNITQSCIMLRAQPEKQETVKENNTTPLSVSKKQDPQAFLEAQKDIARLQSGQPTLAEQQQAEVEQQRQQELAQRIGAQVTPEQQMAGVQPMAAGVGMGQEQAQPIDMKQLGLSVATDPSILQSVAGGVGVALLAAKGAGTGATIAGPWGAVIGAVGGLSFGVYQSVRSNIRSQKADNIGAQEDVLTDGRTNLEQLISLMNLNPANAEMYVEAMNEQLNSIEGAHSQLKIDTQSDLNLALSLDGTRALQRYENFYSAGGGYDVFTTKAQAALAAPDSEAGMRGLLMSSNKIMGGNDD